MVQNSNKFYTMAFRFSQSVVLDNILIKSHPLGALSLRHVDKKDATVSLIKLPDKLEFIVV